MLLNKASIRQILLALYIATLCFFAYTCVFAFRKPFSVAVFEGSSIGGLTYQTALIISQVIGYMLSKFVGIRFISALKRTGRWKAGILLIGTSWLALFVFAWVPPVWGLLCFMVNGFTLGFMWGVVFSYAEGRRSTDFIGSALAVSFVFAGGFTRSVGKWLMQEQGVPEKWMPFITGLVFAGPLVLFFYLLEKMPRPDALDMEERQERVSMSHQDRRLILRNFGAGLVVLCVIYTLLTVMRDIRDNYMGNMWTELGFAGDVSVLTRSESKITIVLLAIMSTVVLIRTNIRAFRTIHGIIMSGFAIAGITSVMFVTGNLSGEVWMQSVGLGLYMAYIPFNSIFFERMIATFRLRGNVGFLIYITDAFGYLGSVSVMLTKEWMNVQLTWSAFYSQAVIGLSIGGVLGTAFALYYFDKKYRQAVS